MYAAIVLLSLILGMISVPAAHGDVASSGLRPLVIGNGSDVVTLPFPSDDPNGTATSIAFGPDGTAYFVDAPNEVASVTPAGVYKKIPVPRASTFNIIYARGKLWMNAGSSGIVEVSPDGSRSRWYSFYSHGNFYATGIALGANDVIYVGGTYCSSTQCPIGAFQAIDTHGVVRTIATPVAPIRLTANKAHQLYFGYNSGPGGFARLEADGSTTLLPWPYPQYEFDNGLQSLVGSIDGNVYFSTYVFPPAGTGYAGFFGRISPSGVITQIPLPFQDHSYLDDVATDFGGNVWLGFQVSSKYHELYQYDIYTGKFTGPYEQTLIDQLYSGPFVGPDDNIWTVRLDTDLHHYYQPMALQVLVRKVQTLEPTATSVSAGNPASFSILETHFGGPWTAVSLSPSIATVSPASSTSGRFTVSETRAGTTSIIVKDTLGNFSYETVVAH